MTNATPPYNFVFLCSAYVIANVNCGPRKKQFTVGLREDILYICIFFSPTPIASIHGEDEFLNSHCCCKIKRKEKKRKTISLQSSPYATKP